MKRFESSDVLLIVSIGFILLVMLGLTLQSCRTVQREGSTQALVQTESHNKTIVAGDHVSLSSLAQKWEDDTRLIVRDFTLVRDSGGHPFPILQRETELTHNRTYQHDSTSANSNNKISASSNCSKDVDERKEAESVDRKTPLNFSFLGLVSFLGLLILFLCKSRKRLLN